MHRERVNTFSHECENKKTEKKIVKNYGVHENDIVKSHTTFYKSCRHTAKDFRFFQYKRECRWSANITKKKWTNHAKPNRNKYVSKSLHFDRRQIREDNRDFLSALCIRIGSWRVKNWSCCIRFTEHVHYLPFFLIFSLLFKQEMELLMWSVLFVCSWIGRRRKKRRIFLKTSQRTDNLYGRFVYG